MCFKYCITNHDLQTSSSTNVLAAHHSKRGNASRPALPYGQLGRSASTSLASGPSNSADSSFISTSTSGSVMRTNHTGGLERTVRSREHLGTSRRPPKPRQEPLTDDDKVNIEQACLCLVAAMCQIDCWPDSSSFLKGLVNEAFTQANAIASREGREPSILDKYFERDVSTRY